MLDINKIKNMTNGEICDLLENDGMALQYIENQTMCDCILAVIQNKEAIKFVKNIDNKETILQIALKNSLSGYINIDGIKMHYAVYKKYRFIKFYFETLTITRGCKNV